MPSRSPQRDQITRANCSIASLLLLVLVALIAQLGVARGEDEAPTEGNAEPPPVELAGRRTETSDTYRLAEGALQTKVFSSRVNFEGQDDEWIPIDEGLEATPEEGITNGENSFDLSLPERIGQGPVRLETDEGWVSSELLGSVSKPAEIEDNVASYEIGEGGTTFDMASEAQGIKENIRLEDPLQPRLYRYKLDASSGVTPVLTPDGGVAFRGEAGALVAQMPPPVLYDSSPQPQGSREAHYELSPSEEGAWELTLDADSPWLADPERHWPVTLDPSLYTAAPPGRDCMITVIEKASGSLSPSDNNCKTFTGSALLQSLRSRRHVPKPRSPLVQPPRHPHFRQRDGSVSQSLSAEHPNGQPGRGSAGAGDDQALGQQRDLAQVWRFKLDDSGWRFQQ